MQRKRKTPSPFFRLSAPYDPVAGSDAPLDPIRKPFCRFTLEEDLTTATKEVKATLTDKWTWGHGIYHCPDVKIHVWNVEIASSGKYFFSGVIGDNGIASHMFNNHWRILSMLNGGLRGACLDEDHPGRGVVFDVHLGAWDSSAHEWVYDTETVSKAIDWRYGVPYPDLGATGLFEARPSQSYGIIWECVSLDCESPGPCGS